MFRRLNKIIRNNPLRRVTSDQTGQGPYRRRLLCSSTGQAAVVLILVIAVALIFYAVTLNFGHFSQIKALTTIASNTSASYLGSMMSSYAQMLVQTQLGGDRKVCGWTGLFAAILTLIIVVIVTWLTWGAGTGAAVAAGKALAIAGIVMAGVAVILQATVVQPGITDAWNRIIQKTLSLGNQFTENAIQQALGKVVTDQVQVADITDLDSDGFWDPSVDSHANCLAACGSSLDPANAPCIAACNEGVDIASRYAAYYTRRLQNVATGPVDEIRQFLAELDEFVNENCDPNAIWGADCPAPQASPWAIHDHMIPETCLDNAECHPCCVPSESELIAGGGSIGGVVAAMVNPPNLRPDDCDPNTNWEVECGLASPYGANYPWVFDGSYENINNDFYSFRELLGKDDEHRDFYKDNELPPDCSALGWDPNCNPQYGINPADSGFYAEDSTNYYVPPFFTPAVPERQRGIFPYFYKMRDWGVDLTLLDVTTKPRECHWCDLRGPSCPDCSVTFDGPHPHPNEIPQLALPLDPGTLPVNNTYWVDGTNTGTITVGGVSRARVATDPPLWVDKVDLAQDIFAADDICAEESVYPAPTADGFWKPGLDRYCSTTWPYFLECPKNAGNCDDGFGGTVPDNCSCADGVQPASEFPDDTLDGLYLGLGDFAEWAEDLLAQGQDNIYQLANNFHLWYPDAGRWIQGAGNNPCGTGCEIYGADEGFLHRFLAEMIEVRNRIDRWIVNQDVGSPGPEGYVGNSCTEVWCIPPDACPEVQPDESATFDSNNNGIVGDIEDVIACLDHNTTTDGGNAARFQTCYDACLACALDENDCDDTINNLCGGAPGTYLPRSLVPGWDPNIDFIPVDMGQLAQVQACDTGECSDCFTTCSDDATTCQNDCNTVNANCTTTCTTNYNTCETACGPAPDPNIDPVGFAAYTACVTACDDTQTACNDLCATDLAACSAICTADQDACDSACMCTSLGIACTAADISNASEASRGSCGETGPGTYLDFLEQSIPEAANQVAKFQHRRNFLEGRLNEANAIIDDVLDPAIAMFQQFLNGPAQDLITARALFDPSDSGIPNQAVYGWRDPDNPDGTRGKWHIVKVEAKSLDYCDERCAADQVSPNPGWPRVRTYTKSWGTKRCYELDRETGSVKFRTTRYDEESSGNVFSFPNGEPIWRFRTFHPSRPQGGAFSPGGLDGDCQVAELNTFIDGSSTLGIYDGAFMMDTRTPQNADCWDLAHTLLTRGVTSQSCGVYGWLDGRMDFEFVECEPF